MSIPNFVPGPGDLIEPPRWWLDAAPPVGIEDDDAFDLDAFDLETADRRDISPPT